jgi:hypothetical protein
MFEKVMHPCEKDFAEQIHFILVSGRLAKNKKLLWFHAGSISNDSQQPLAEKVTPC